MIKKNFTRKDLSNKIHQNLGFSKNLSLELIENFFELIILELIQSGKIKISSFGTFQVKNKKGRMGRNPKTKVDAKISARKVVKFKPAISVKLKLNNT